LTSTTIASTTFLARPLLFYYRKQSPWLSLFDQWFVERAEDFDIHHGNGPEDAEQYNQALGLPLKEMKLNKDHVERRMRIAATDRGEIHRLMNSCDWAGQATLLTHDREAATLVDGQYLRDPDTVGFFKLVLQRTDEIQGTYFTDFTSASTYTASEPKNYPPSAQLVHQRRLRRTRGRLQRVTWVQ